MNPLEVDKKSLIRVGIFTVVALIAIAAFTVFVNDKPFWWRDCQPVSIEVEDATGLKPKSPVRSLGLQIGYLKSVELSERSVLVTICVTAPVEVLPETRGYIRGEGFLGDKFLEIKPVHYVGKHHAQNLRLLDFLIPSASAKEDDKPKQIPVGSNGADMDRLMQSADKLMVEVTELTKNLKSGIHPDELRATIQELNRTLKNATQTLSPEGGISKTAIRSLEKLEDTVEQLRQQITRINKGEGSLGRILNDPVYADELEQALKNINWVLNRVTNVRFLVNIGFEQIHVYDGGRGYIQLSIFPNPSRYYLIGLTIDPRGKLRVINTTTSAGGTTTQVHTEQTEQGGLLLTGMLGKVFFKRLDVAIGALHGDGAGSLSIHLGPRGIEDTITVRNDIYSRGTGIAMNDRFTFQVRPFFFYPGGESIYLKAGIDSVRKVDGRYATFVGAGLSFTDNDIKLLFSLL